MSAGGRINRVDDNKEFKWWLKSLTSEGRRRELLHRALATVKEANRQRALRLLIQRPYVNVKRLDLQRCVIEYACGYTNKRMLPPIAEESVAVSVAAPVDTPNPFPPQKPCPLSRKRRAVSAEEVAIARKRLPSVSIEETVVPEKKPTEIINLASPTTPEISSLLPLNATSPCPSKIVPASTSLAVVSAPLATTDASVSSAVVKTLATAVTSESETIFSRSELRNPHEEFNSTSPTVTSTSISASVSQLMRPFGRLPLPAAKGSNRTCFSQRVMEEALKDIARCVSDSETEFCNLDKRVVELQQLPPADRSKQIEQLCVESYTMLSMKAASVRSCMDRGVVKALGRNFYPELLREIQRDSRFRYYSTMRLVTVVNMLAKLTKSGSDPKDALDNYLSKSLCEQQQPSALKQTSQARKPAKPTSPPLTPHTSVICTTQNVLQSQPDAVGKPHQSQTASGSQPQRSQPGTAWQRQQSQSVAVRHQHQSQLPMLSQLLQGQSVAVSQPQQSRTVAVNQSQCDSQPLAVTPAGLSQNHYHPQQSLVSTPALSQPRSQVAIAPRCEIPGQSVPLPQQRQLYFQSHQHFETSVSGTGVARQHPVPNQGYFILNSPLVATAQSAPQQANSVVTLVQQQSVMPQQQSSHMAAQNHQYSTPVQATHYNSLQNHTAQPTACLPQQPHHVQQQQVVQVSSVVQHVGTQVQSYQQHSYQSQGVSQPSLQTGSSQNGYCQQPISQFSNQTSSTLQQAQLQQAQLQQAQLQQAQLQQAQLQQAQLQQSLVRQQQMQFQQHSMLQPATNQSQSLQYSQGDYQQQSGGNRGFVPSRQLSIQEQPAPTYQMTGQVLPVARTASRDSGISTPEPGQKDYPCEEQYRAWDRRSS